MLHSSPIPANQSPHLPIASSLIVIWLLTVSACDSKSVPAPVTDNSPPKTEAKSEAPSAPEPKRSKDSEHGSLPDISSTVSEFDFVTVGPESGLNFTRYDDIRGQRRIIESTGGGVAMLDSDADGWLDLFFTGGCRVPEALDSAEPTCDLFRNLGSANFTKITTPSNLMMPGYCQGCAVGDIDGDGFDDLYVTAFGRNGLWRSNGDGTFENITEIAGVQDPAWSTGCAFADLNLDGHLDLYVANYLDESPHEPQLCPNASSPDGYEQCAPSKYEGVDDKLFLSNGMGVFVNATEPAGIAGLKGKGLGVVISDFNSDGRPEIYVANDGQANFLFTPTQVSNQNAARIQIPTFEERALTTGCALSASGYAQASMGIAAGDFDKTGTIDLLLTHFIRDSNTLYLNQGDLHFSDNTRTSGLLGPSKAVLGWGTVFQDFDGDSFLDLFVANGHVEDRRWMRRDESYMMQAQVFKNAGSGRFKQVDHAGSYFEKLWLGRGVAAGDLNGDHVPDLAVSHQLEPSVALINRTPQQFTRTTITLVGTRSNRSAFNATLIVKNSEGHKIDFHEIIGGGSFQSASSKLILLALNRDTDYHLEVRWPSGRQTSYSVLGRSSNFSGNNLVIVER